MVQAFKLDSNNMLTGCSDDLVKRQELGCLATKGGAGRRKEKKKWIHDSGGTLDMDRTNVQIGMIPEIRSPISEDSKFRGSQIP